jgi:hypothetical protein
MRVLFAGEIAERDDADHVLAVYDGQAANGGSHHGGDPRDRVYETRRSSVSRI